jgi:hypothetical protein
MRVALLRNCAFLSHVIAREMYPNFLCAVVMRAEAAKTLPKHIVWNRFLDSAIPIFHESVKRFKPHRVAIALPNCRIRSASISISRSSSFNHHRVM